MITKVRSMRERAATSAPSGNAVRSTMQLNRDKRKADLADKQHARYEKRKAVAADQAATKKDLEDSLADNLASKAAYDKLQQDSLELAQQLALTHHNQLTLERARTAAAKEAHASCERKLNIARQTASDALAAQEHKAAVYATKFAKQARENQTNAEQAAKLKSANQKLRIKGKGPLAMLGKAWRRVLKDVKLGTLVRLKKKDWCKGKPGPKPKSRAAARRHRACFRKSQVGKGKTAQLKAQHMQKLQGFRKVSKVSTNLVRPSVLAAVELTVLPHLTETVACPSSIARHDKKMHSLYTAADAVDLKTCPVMHLGFDSTTCHGTHYMSVMVFSWFKRLGGPEEKRSARPRQLLMDMVVQDDASAEPTAKLIVKTAIAADLNGHPIGFVQSDSTNTNSGHNGGAISYTQQYAGDGSRDNGTGESGSDPVPANGAEEEFSDCEPEDFMLVEDLTQDLFEDCIMQDCDGGGDGSGSSTGDHWFGTGERLWFMVVFSYIMTLPKH